MKVSIENNFWQLFPKAKIGIVITSNIKNKYDTIEKYTALLKEAQNNAQKHISEAEFSDNLIIKNWRNAFQKFKTKKGVRSSIESLLKRIYNGKELSNINPLVDIYNSVSLEFGVPCGGEDIDKIMGTMRLTLADGGEDFITLGCETNDPPYKGELIYKDDKGAICRCWNWRESVRTMLTEDTKNAIFVIETNDNTNHEDFLQALSTLQYRITHYLGGHSEIIVLDKNNPNYPF